VTGVQTCALPICTGCGRCIKFCPVSVDIRRIVLDLMEREAAVKTSEEAKP
jgi:ferredoxin